ncbi:hypothetical protein [Undibacterium sp. TJN19]|uniref:hypothetical protein n=1 Tax=Undibacterium sp. TJN19 TaxID=3413055 RepID=UPI003BF1DD1E
MKKINSPCFAWIFAWIFSLRSMSAMAQTTEKPGDALLPMPVCTADLPRNVETGPWLALTRHGGQWRLSATQVKSEILPEIESSGSFSNVSSSIVDPVILLRHPAVMTGPVTYHRILKTALPATLPSRLQTKFNHHLYQFRIQPAEEQGGYPLIMLYSEGRMSQLGYMSINKFDEIENHLLWAGDLDHDGRLDLITESGGSQGAQVCVYLSGDARGQELFGEPMCVQTRTYEGC